MHSVLVIQSVNATLGVVFISCFLLRESSILRALRASLGLQGVDCVGCCCFHAGVVVVGLLSMAASLCVSHCAVAVEGDHCPLREEGKFVEDSLCFPCPGRQPVSAPIFHEPFD